MNRYENYKDSGIAWLGEIPEHWEVKKFRFLFNLTKGLTITKANLKSSGIPCVNYGEIHSKYGFEVIPERDELKYVDKNYLETSNQSLLERGNFVFADTSEDIEGSGNFTHLHSDTNIFAGYHTIIARLKIDINYRYVAYFFESIAFRNQVRQQVKGVKVYSITNAILKDTFIFLPSKQEQLFIANYLNKKTTEIDELIAQKEQLLALYEGEKAAIINQTVTKGVDSDVTMKESGVPWLGDIPEDWEVKKFRFLFNLTKGLTITKANLKSNGIPCVNYGEIHSKYGFEVIPERDELKYVDKNYLETSNQSLLERGNFVFADTSEDIEGSGNFTHLHSDTNIFAGYHTIIARLKIDINYRYVAYFFESIAFRNQVRQQVKGVKVYSITNAILKDTFIFLPSKQEQHKIVNVIENELSRIDTKIQKTKKIITLQKEYRIALISEVVTGKIKVPEEI